MSPLRLRCAKVGKLRIFNLSVFDFSWTFRGVNADFFFNFADIFLPTKSMRNTVVYNYQIGRQIFVLGKNQHGPIMFTGTKI
jgi:hypothetical protein